MLFLSLNYFSEIKIFYIFFITCYYLVYLSCNDSSKNSRALNLLPSLITHVLNITTFF